MKKYWMITLVLALTLVISSEAEAKNRCCRNKCRTSVRIRSTCNSTSVRVHSVGSTDLQAWAEREARLMSEYNTNGHVSPPPQGTFVGVGCNGMTCQGSGRLAAEAHINGKSVRVWVR